MALEAEASLAAKVSTRYVRLGEGSGHGAIASGSFGRVYAAVDQETKATVAVKRQLSTSTSAQRELCFYKAASQAKHDNVMHLLDHFTEKVGGNAFLYMVFEFMDTTLWRFWQHRRRLVAPMQAHAFVLQLVSGVGHLHRLDIVHSDLSMANVLVGGCEPSLRIADLGSAMDAASMVLKPGSVITTEAWRAPEVFLGTLRPTVAIDLWGLGVLAVALLTGSLIFWQDEGCEPRVLGLKGHSSPVQGLARKNMDVQGLPTLHNQVAFLGPVSDEVWPECASLPAYVALQPLLSRRGLRSCAAAFLADKSLVGRPLAVDEAANSFVVSLLRWDPAKRLRATDCLEHPFLRSPCNAPVFVQTLVNQVSEKALREVVVQSINSGAAVTQEMLCAMLERVELPSAKRLRVKSEGLVGSEPHQGDAQTDSQQAVVVPSQAVVASSASQASVAASQASAAARQEMCECRGNCGIRACKAAKNKLRANSTNDSPYCNRPKLQGESYCAFCKCERCSRPRLKIRWCVKCERDVSMSLKPKHYANKYGVFALPTIWHRDLKLAARLAYITSLAPSVDAFAWSTFVAKLLQFRGHATARQLTEVGEMFLVVLVAGIREPRAVQDACGLLHGCNPVRATEAEWGEYVSRLIVSANQQGERGSIHWCLEVVREHPVVWPVLSASQDMPTAEQVYAFAHSCSHLVNLLTAQESMHSEACLRLLTLLERDFGSSVWDATSMRDLVRWVAPSAGHCSQLLGMSGKEVRERFGSSPLMVPGHVRMWGTVQKSHIAPLLNADARKCVNIVAESQADSGCLPLPVDWVPSVV